ncbi:MAG: hypothetical protein GY811_07585 [Myxococcales bacterium]|nr:hypothetical protein [Myxococcales bacterium]
MALAAGEEAEAAEVSHAAKSQKPSDLQAVDVVRDCIPSAKLQVGVSLGSSLRSSAEGAVKRSFTGRLPFSRSEIGCIKQGLSGVETVSEEEVGQMMGYDLYVSASSERTRSLQSRH